MGILNARVKYHATFHMPVEAFRNTTPNTFRPQNHSQLACHIVRVNISDARVDGHEVYLPASTTPLSSLVKNSQHPCVGQDSLLLEMYLPDEISQVGTGVVELRGNRFALSAPNPNCGRLWSF